MSKISELMSQSIYHYKIVLNAKLQEAFLALGRLPSWNSRWRLPHSNGKLGGDTPISSGWGITSLKLTQIRSYLQSLRRRRPRERRDTYKKECEYYSTSWMTCWILLNSWTTNTCLDSWVYPTVPSSTAWNHNHRNQKYSATSQTARITKA